MYYNYYEINITNNFSLNIYLTIKFIICINKILKMLKHIYEYTYNIRVRPIYRLYVQYVSSSKSTLITSILEVGGLYLEL